MKRSEGVSDPPTKVSAKNIPTTDPRMLNQNDSLVPRKILGDAIKYGMSNTPVKNRDVLNKSDETRLEFPEYATNLPKSLRKLYTKENPGEFGSLMYPPE